MNPKLGQLVEVENKNRKFGSNSKYFAVHVSANDEVYPLLLSHNELQVGISRAEANGEDVPKIKTKWFQFLFK